MEMDEGWCAAVLGVQRSEHYWRLNWAELKKLSETIYLLQSWMVVLAWKHPGSHLPIGRTRFNMNVPYLCQAMRSYHLEKVGLMEGIGQSHIWGGASLLSGCRLGDDLSRVVSVPLLEQKPWWWSVVWFSLFECKHCYLQRSSFEAGWCWIRGPDVGMARSQGLNFGYLTMTITGLFMSRSHVSTSNICPILAQAFTLVTSSSSQLRSILSCGSPHSSVKLWCEAKQDWALSQAGTCTSAEKPLVQASHKPLNASHSDKGTCFPCIHSPRTGGDVSTTSDNSLSKESSQHDLLLSPLHLLGNIVQPNCFSIPFYFHSLLPDILPACLDKSLST